MTDKPQSLNKRVVKIRPSWELVAQGDSGEMYFEFTDEPKNYKPDIVRTKFNEKIIKEMENRRKL